MHEVSIVESMLERVHEEARRKRATRVLAIEVAVGELAGVEIDLLESAYALLRERETDLVAGAELRVESVPARFACPACGAPHTAGGRLRCPTCDLPLRLADGGEILLQRIEMEVA